MSVYPNAVYGCTTGKMYYQEKAEHEKTSSNKASSIGQVGRIVKMGPCGGGRGIVRDIDPCNFRRILKMVVWHGGAVSGVLGLYDLDDQEGEELIGREGKRSEVLPPFQITRR